MSILDRYLFWAIARGSAMVLVLLLALSGFVNLVDQLDEVGEGAFTTVDALFMVLFQWPRHAFEMFPIAVLIGSLFGLGNLANHNELVAIRAAGVSMLRLAWTTLLAGIVLAGIAGVVGEYITPPAERFAENYKDELLQEGPSMSRLAGTWFRDGPRILNFLQVQVDDEVRAAGVYTFEFDPGGRLLTVGHATSADLVGGEALEMENYVATHVEGETAYVERVGEKVIDTGLGVELLEASEIPAESMASPSLRDYIGYLKANDLQSLSYELAYWSRLSNTVAVAVMALLALPFVFGSLRSGGHGLRLVIGVLVGVVYFLAQGALADSAAVYGIPPLGAAWIPVGFLLFAALIGLARAR